MINFFKKKFYTLTHSKKILRWGFDWYKKKGNTLAPRERDHLEKTLEDLDQAILAKDKESSTLKAKELENFGQEKFNKSPFDYIKEVLGAILIALLVATLVRQMWFELYEIPTGSMRPTFKEQDHLTVSKTAFGINYPLKTKHLYFDPDLVNRTGIVIWSGDGVDLPDVDTTYFGIIPYKKRFVKRLIGKPGDSLYFYGGKIYGIDKHNQPIKELLEAPWLDKIEYIPFITFQGKPTSNAPGEVVFQQMNLPVGKLTFNQAGRMSGQIYDNKQWLKENFSPGYNKIKGSYTDFMGMGNFAMARLLTKKELEKFDNYGYTDLEEGVLYLQLNHHPNLNNPPPTFPIEGGVRNILLTPQVSIIPLKQKHLDAIMENLYTARFVVKDGVARRYSAEKQPFTKDSPSFPGIPDGRYEFYYGKGSYIGWGAIAYDLPSDHPLYQKTPANVQKLFNLGIEFNKLFEPKNSNQVYFPHRYAYFRDGDLYLMGAPILKKDDPTLKSFLEKEAQKEKNSTLQKPYMAFKDYGPPLQNGKFNSDLIKAFGVKVPDHHYLVLGDNHAMSADSRVFGFVPQENLEGVPSLIIWPPGPRLGSPPQYPYQLFALPRLIIWGIVLVLLGIWYAIHQYRLNQPVYRKIW